MNDTTVVERPALRVKPLAQVEYEPTWQAMKAFTLARTGDTPDELWLVAHPPVYTLGVGARPAHLPRTDNGIPVVRTDRGGQITYHGPGQVVAYLLLDMKRRCITVRPLVRLMETAVINLLADYGIDANARSGAPGVYVGESKVAALGLRVSRGCSYHGVALNVDMDLSPFLAIDPCGYSGLAVTQLKDLGVTDAPPVVAERLTRHLTALLA